MASSSYSGMRRTRDDSPSPIRDANWFDVPLVFALVPAIGSLLTGSDLLKDFLHLAFLLYYLHNLIKVPWTLYTAARARRSTSAVRDTSEDQLRALARSELRMAELVYLVFTIIAPFLGAILLRSISQLLSIDTVSTFSTSLFVLSTGIRPWRHLVHLLQRRTEALHDVVHSPSADTTASRIASLEAELAELKAALLGQRSGVNVLEAATTSLDAARKDLLKETKQAEQARLELEARVEVLEGTAFARGGPSARRRFRALVSAGDVESEVDEGEEQEEYRAPSLPPYDAGGNGSGATVTITLPKLVLQPLGLLAGILPGGKEKSGRSGLQGKGLGEELKHGSGGGGDEQGGLVEWVVHTALFPLRFVRACALVLLRQVG